MYICIYMHMCIYECTCTVYNQSKVNGGTHVHVYAIDVDRNTLVADVYTCSSQPGMQFTHEASYVR